MSEDLSLTHVVNEWSAGIYATNIFSNEIKIMAIEYKGNNFFWCA